MTDSNTDIKLQNDEVAIVFSQKGEVKLFLPQKDTEEVQDNELLAMSLCMHLENRTFVKNIIKAAKSAVIEQSAKQEEGE